MGVYNRNPQLKSPLITCDTRNCLRLRSDIRNQLDLGAFVFVPKCGTSRIHFLAETQEYGRLLHNRETEEFCLGPQFVYARFAWAVLHLAQPFREKDGMKLHAWNAERNEWEGKAVNTSASPKVHTYATARSPQKRRRLEPQDGGDSTPVISVDVPVPDSDVSIGSRTAGCTPPSQSPGYRKRKEIFRNLGDHPTRSPADCY